MRGGEVRENEGRDSRIVGMSRRGKKMVGKGCRGRGELAGKRRVGE